MAMASAVPSRGRFPGSRCCLVWALALLGPGTATQALALGNDTVFVDASAGVSHDSNLYRLSPQAQSPATLRLIGVDKISETIFTYGLGANFKLPYARQSFEGSFNASLNRFVNSPTLDYTSTQANAAWHWRAGRDWTGDLSYSSGRVIQSFENFNANPNKNLITNNFYHLLGRYDLDTRWQFTTIADYANHVNGSALFQSGDSNTVSVQELAQYRWTTGSSLGLKLRVDDGQTPNQTITPNSIVDNRYTEVRATNPFYFVLSARSNLGGEWGLVDRKHPDVPQRNFNGFVGSLSYNYQATARGALGVNVNRELGGGGDLVQVYRRSYTLSVSPSYELTNKLLWRGNAQWINARYQGNTGFLPAFLLAFFPERQDHLTNYSNSLVYSVTRNAQVSASVNYARRESSIAGATFIDLTTSVNASLQF